MKMGLCMEKKIALVVVHPEDLTLESMRHKVGHLMPLRNLTGHEHVIDYLESASRRYLDATKQ